MARLSRYVLPGVPQHIIQRGNNREAIFGEEADYSAYLDWLTDAAEANGLQVHAYVLMTNHVHLLATPDSENSIGRTMQSLGRRYVQYFNYRYQRTGTLWEGRYRATVIEAETWLMRCSQYIEMNPVRAGMVRSPSQYPWSSYRHNAMGWDDALISPHALYKQLGRNAEQRQAAYQELFKTKVDAGALTDLRDATNKGWALGGMRFKDQIEALAERRAAPRPKGRPRKAVSE